VQNVRHGHYELAVEEPVHRRVAIAFDEVALRSDPSPTHRFSMPWVGAMQHCRVGVVLGSAPHRFTFGFASCSRLVPCRWRHMVSAWPVYLRVDGGRDNIHGCWNGEVVQR
jgi:hypothetical protein